MKWKYIIVLLLFFGNLFIAMLEQQTRDLSHDILLSHRRRLLLRINEVMAYVIAVLLALMVYMSF